MKKNIMLIPLIIALILFVFSSINIVLWFIDNKETTKQISEINAISPIKVITITDKDTEEEDKFISVDFEQLKNFNNEIVGWINIPSTNVNYPILKHDDNAFYLNHSIDKSKNKAGWIYLDYRNNLDDKSKNTIIYGHNRLDKTMFGSLNDLTKEEYLNSKEKYIYISTEKTNYKYEIFSIYRINSTDDYIQTVFTDEEYSEWLNMIKSRSVYDFNLNVTESDTVLTLSTCYQHVKKLVVHAKLVDEQTR